jgi:hypothetical protein
MTDNPHALNMTTINYSIKSKEGRATIATEPSSHASY